MISNMKMLLERASKFSAGVAVLIFVLVRFYEHEMHLQSCLVIALYGCATITFLLSVPYGLIGDIREKEPVRWRVITSSLFALIVIVAYMVFTHLSC